MKTNIIFSKRLFALDIQGRIIAKIRGLRLGLLEFYSNFYMKFELLVKKVTVGKGANFVGKTYVVRYPGSSITIGSKCTFRSDTTSNLIGVMSKCILSTHNDKAVLTIGDSCGFSGTVVAAKEKITIGNNVLFGANTLITDFDWHGIEPDKRRNYSGDSKEVTIGNNVFLGYGSVVLKGVTIGENSVIGANSVVTRDVPANVIAGGNPCKVIRNL